MPLILGNTVKLVESARKVKPACAVNWFCSLLWLSQLDYCCALYFPCWYNSGFWKPVDFDDKLRILPEG